MIEDRAYFEQQLAQLRQEIDSYQTEKLLPLQQEKARLAEEQSKLEASLKKLKEERDAAVFQIARINQQVSAAAQAQQAKQAELTGKQREADAAAARIADLRRRTEAETDRLSAMQQEGAELEQTRLPQLKNLLTEQEQHSKLLADNVSAMEQRKQTLAADQLRLQEEEAGLVKTLAELNQTHASLTASCDAKNEQLQELRKKVEELRGKNGREQERRYRQQLSDELAQLEEISNTCEDLERELAAVKTNCANKQAQAEQLRRQKQAADDAERSINAALQLLTPFANSKLQQRVQALQDRHKLLSETHERLEEAVNMMQTTLDIPPEALISNPEGLSESLQTCGKALDKLQRALVRCANQIKAEIKLDVKMEEQ